MPGSAVLGAPAGAQRARVAAEEAARLGEPAREGGGAALLLRRRSKARRRSQRRRRPLGQDARTITPAAVAHRASSVPRAHQATDPARPAAGASGPPSSRRRPQARGAGAGGTQGPRRVPCARPVGASWPDLRRRARPARASGWRAQIYTETALPLQCWQPRAPPARRPWRRARATQGVQSGGGGREGLIDWQCVPQWTLGGALGRERRPAPSLCLAPARHRAEALRLQASKQQQNSTRGGPEAAARSGAQASGRGPRCFSPGARGVARAAGAPRGAGRARRGAAVAADLGAGWQRAPTRPPRRAPRASAREGR